MEGHNKHWFESKDNIGTGHNLPFIITFFKVSKCKITKKFIIPNNFEENFKAVFVKHPKTNFDNIWLSPNKQINVKKLSNLYNQNLNDIKVVDSWLRLDNLIMLGKGIDNDKASLNQYKNLITPENVKQIN